MTNTSHFRLVSVLTAMIFSASSLTGCFNTYRVSPDEFAKLQQSDEIPVTVLSEDGEKVAVDKDTHIFVRSAGGRRYPVTPYNFKMTPSQLVASDRDTLLSLQEIEDYEVDLFSNTQTILLISAGVAAVAALIVVTAITAGNSSFGGGDD